MLSAVHEFLSQFVSYDHKLLTPKWILYLAHTIVAMSSDLNMSDAYYIDVYFSH